MKALIQRAMQFRRARAFARYEHACHDPAAAQETALRWLVERSGHTALARRLGATPGQVRSIDDLRRRVPLTSYDEIRPRDRRGVAGAARPADPRAAVVLRADLGHHRALQVHPHRRRVPPRLPDSDAALPLRGGARPPARLLGEGAVHGGAPRGGAHTGRRGGRNHLRLQLPRPSEAAGQRGRGALAGLRRARSPRADPRHRPARAAP
ncbi:MAG: GH3 auxin-responsive promoter family protein [Sandaracinaceae bacterium]|nr:GH3 auxin-responsive promoter family protein [Sandaracinaceae bacterium]